MAVGVHAVTVAGVSISHLVEQVSINHGREDDTGQPEASGATLDVLVFAPDVLPSVVEIGASLSVTTSSGGTAYARFTGRITDMHMGWQEAGEDTPEHAVGQLVAVGLLADTGRRVVGDVPFPQELDGARVSRVLALAGVTLDPAYSDPGTAQILPRDIDSQPALNVAQDAAQSASGIIWETRAGEIRYADAEHRAGIQPTLSLDARDLLVTPTWRRATDGLVNDISVGYGATPGGGEQPRYVVSDAASIGRYGHYGYSVATALAALADAQAMANLLLVRNSSPVWLMASLPVAITELDDAKYQQLLSLDMHSLLTLTGLPAIGSAPTSANLWVEGWKETLAWGVHELELQVSGYCRTSVPPTWDNVAPSWLWGSHTEVARNRLTNPSFELATTNWVAARGTLGLEVVPGAPAGTQALAYSVTDASIAGGAGNYCYHSPTLLDITPGAPYSFSVLLQPKTAAGAGARAHAWLQWYDAAGAYIGLLSHGPYLPNPVGAWTQLTVSAVAPPNAFKVGCFVMPGATPPVGDGYWLDAAILTETADVVPYFDGDTPSTASDLYAWTGTPKLSPSTRSTFQNGATVWTPYRRNEILNPRIPNASNWANLGAGGAVTASNPYSNNVAAAEGQAISVAVDVMAPPGAALTGYLAARPTTGGAFGSNPLAGTNFNIPAGQTQRISNSYVVPAGADGFRLMLGSLSVIDGTAKISRPIAELAAATGSYFDGQTTSTQAERYEWTGARDASASLMSRGAVEIPGVPPDLTWDGASCFGPPTSYGRWDDVAASLRWDQVPAATTWDTWKG